MERRYNWVAKYKELEYKYYRLAQGLQPKPDEPTTGGAELYIENIGDEAGVFSVQRNGSPTYTPNLEVKVGNSGWIAYNIVEGGTTEVTVPKGSKIYLRGNNPSGFNGGNDTNNSFSFTFSQPYSIGGYLTSLLVVEDFQSINHIPDYSFCRLFLNTSIKSAKDLITSNITSVGNSSFQDCFFSCMALSTAPTFEEVTSVGDSGFQGCFYNCYGLVTAPTFERVTTVGVSGFHACFCFCTPLVTAPTFERVTTVGDSGFVGCFDGCTSLETITAPSPSYWDTPCFENWVNGVPSTGTFIKKYGLDIPSGTSGIPEGWTVEYIPEPFYIENIDSETGIFMLRKYGTPTYKPNLKYKVDNSEWLKYDTSTLPGIKVPAGSKIYLKGDNQNGINKNTESYYTLQLYSTYSTTSECKKCNIGGCITSLLALDNFHLINTIPQYSFSNLLYYNLGLISAEKLNTSNITSVGGYGFYNCFRMCTYLVTAPTFENVTSVGDNGFYFCFQGCHSLVTAPTFENVTSVGNQTFNSCFDYCKSLVTAPTFENVTSVGTKSFGYCFNDCTSLETITAPSPSTWETSNFTNWVQNVRATGTFYKKSGLEIPSGASGIPDGWTVVEV